MQFPTITSPHTARPNSVTRAMLWVIIALIPGAVALTWYFGWGIPIHMALATATALGAEALVLRLRKRPVKPALMDLSAVVTALLMAVALPPLLPWWILVIGVVFAIVVVKQLYGGIGYNPFNPAMAGYVLLLVSYPVDMTSWVPPRMLDTHTLDFLQTLTLIFTGQLPAGLDWDAVTAATPLDAMRTQLDQNMMISEIRKSPLWGDFGGKGWEWVGNWFLLGGLVLLYKRVITWRIPVSMLGGLLVMAMLFHFLDQETHPFGLFHVFSGGAILGAFFIATDPVTASTTPRGQLIYGALIGILIYIIRTWGGYPDAVAFAVLLMNLAAPTIDYYTRPRVFGHREERDE
ncbi:MAG TPA: electron transport complex subunit RsxD [Sedimenticola sp.]|nr:electron transport complex subunit RsxD [Sedimenticola sp.]